MPPTRGISCLSLVLYGIRIGSEGLMSHSFYYNLKQCSVEQCGYIDSESDADAGVEAQL